MQEPPRQLIQHRETPVQKPAPRRAYSPWLEMSPRQRMAIIQGRALAGISKGWPFTGKNSAQRARLQGSFSMCTRTFRF